IDSKEDDEKKDDTDDDKSIDLEMTDDEKTDDEVIQGREQVNDDEDEEMLNAKVGDSSKCDAELSNVANADAEKTEEAKDDSKKVELPLTSSSLSISLVLTPVQEASSAPPVITLPPPSISTIPPAPLQQTTAPIHSPPITTDAPTITTAIHESDELSAIQLRVAKLEKDVSELKKIDHSAKALATLKLQVPTVVEQYLGSKIGDDLQKDENAMDEGVANTVKDQKRKHDDDDDDDDEDPLAGPKQGSKTSKSASAKEPVEEQIAEVVMDDADEDTVHDDNQPQDTYEPKTAKTPNPEWFKQPLRPPTPDPKWNKRQVRTYITSITKTKEGRYEIVGIEDMVLTLWITIKHEYDKDAAKGIKHWGERQGDFVNLHLNDIEDMLILAVQHKLFHLNESDIVDFIVALRMFTRSLIIKHRVEDLQLGVESYQKKLNITPPQQTFPEIEFKELYTPSYKPPGVIYEDLAKQKRVMRADELYKFSDGTLKKVQDELHHRILDFRVGYNKEMS
ncbi:hypothetical protein Tco_1324688, partial [Tanacetum coccineum]